MAQSISVPAARCRLPGPPGKVPVDRVLHLVVALPSPWEWMWRLGVLNIPLTGRGSFNGMLPYPLPRSGRGPGAGAGLPPPPQRLCVSKDAVNVSRSQIYSFIRYLNPFCCIGCFCEGGCCRFSPWNKRGGCQTALPSPFPPNPRGLGRCWAGLAVAWPAASSGHPTPAQGPTGFVSAGMGPTGPFLAFPFPTHSQAGPSQRGRFSGVAASALKLCSHGTRRLQEELRN